MTGKPEVDVNGRQQAISRFELQSGILSVNRIFRQSSLKRQRNSLGLIDLH
jgi:hypothetical protein